METEGCNDGWLLGALDIEGSPEGIVLGCEDGCAVGQSDTDGFMDGWLLGDALMEGDSEGVDDGKADADGD